MTRRVDNPDTDADREVTSLLSQSTRGGFVMVAGAGSGKTTSLVKALGYVRKAFGAGLRTHSQQVACITYTEIAVGEILDDVGKDELFHVSTIHRFLWTLIKPFQRDIATWVGRRIEEKLGELRLQRDKPRTQQRTRERSDREIARLVEQRESVKHVTRFNYVSGGDYSAGLLGHDDVIRMGPQLVKERPLLQALIACKYPFCFIDESQDTFPCVVEAFRAVLRASDGKFCLGFFGDPMQQIYMTGVGEIALEPGWRRITKPENFRCPERVLSVINMIRGQGDGLHQVLGRQSGADGIGKTVQGSAQFFVLPADERRSGNLERVRAFLASPKTSVCRVA